MKKFTKLFISFLTIFAISVCTVTSASATTASTNSFTYTFKPKSTVYNTMTSAVYSDPVDYGWSNQSTDLYFSFYLNIPPKTSSFSVYVKADFQRKNGSNWETLTSLTAGGTYSNANSTTYSVKKPYAKKTYTELKKGSTYRVKYTVTKNTAKTKYNLMPTTDMTFNLE